MYVVPVTVNPEPRLLSMSQLMDELLQDAAAAHEAHRTGAPRGPLIPFPKLASIMGEWWWNGVHVIHGTPGVGKTALGLQLAATASCPALYVSAEMAPLELARRILARVSKQYLGRFRGELSPDQMAAYALAIREKLPFPAILDATQAYASPGTIRDMAMAVRGDRPHMLIVIDSLHSWAEGAGVDANEYDALNAGIRALRQLAAELQCAVIVISERNRTSMAAGGLSAGAGTRKIEYGAESVIDLSEEDEENRSNGDETDIVLRVVKNRNGVRGTVKMVFNGALQSYREW